MTYRGTRDGDAHGSAGDDGAVATAGATSTSCRWSLVAIMALGFAVRLTYLRSRGGGHLLPGDARYYHLGANLLADGKGFTEPLYYEFGVRLQGATHPPAFLVVLAGASAVGLRSILAHQLVGCVLGTITVGVVGLAGREIAGPRAGLIAAALSAVYPNFWLNDVVVMSETLVMLAAALVTLAAFRFWRTPTVGGGAILGVTLALAALTRAETVVMLILVAGPIVVYLERTRRQRAALLSVVVTASLLVMAPWIVYNVSRFHHPVFLSTGSGILLSAANCDETYYGA